MVVCRENFFQGRPHFSTNWLLHCLLIRDISQFHAHGPRWRDITHQLFTQVPRNHGNIVCAFAISSVRTVDATRALKASREIPTVRSEVALMSVEDFRMFVIQSRNQNLAGFDVDRLGPNFLNSAERTIPNIFEGFQENCREKVTRTKSLGQKGRKC